MGENKTSLAGVWTAIILLFAILVGGVAYFKYTHDKTAEKADVEQTGNVNIFTAPTVQEKLAEHADAVRETDLYDTYLALPDIILESIYTNIGVTASPTEAAAEYLRNREYYLSLQLSKAINNLKITGPDAGNVEKVELRTTLKKPIEQGESVHSVPIDSIR